ALCTLRAHIQWMNEPQRFSKSRYGRHCGRARPVARSWRNKETRTIGDARENFGFRLILLLNFAFRPGGGLWMRDGAARHRLIARFNTTRRVQGLRLHTHRAGLLIRRKVLRFWLAACLE